MSATKSVGMSVAEECRIKEPRKWPPQMKAVRPSIGSLVIGSEISLCWAGGWLLRLSHSRSGAAT